MPNEQVLPQGSQDGESQEENGQTGEILHYLRTPSHSFIERRSRSSRKPGIRNRRDWTRGRSKAMRSEVPEQRPFIRSSAGFSRAGQPLVYR